MVATPTAPGPTEATAATPTALTQTMDYIALTPTAATPTDSMAATPT